MYTCSNSLETRRRTSSNCRPLGSQYVTATSRDDLGRWVSATITGSGDAQATVFSYYNIVQPSITNAGPSTVFVHQYQLLRLAGDLTPDPRRRFIEDLHMELATRRRKEEELIICGDFNEQICDDLQLMARIAGSHDLFDVHQH
jgi:exonuclease III